MSDRIGGWQCPRRGPIRFDGDTVHPHLVLARLRAVVARLGRGHRVVVVSTTSRGCVELLTDWSDEVQAPRTVHSQQAGGWEVHVYLLPKRLGGVSTPTLHERKVHWKSQAA